MGDIVRDRFDEHPYGWVIVAVSTVCLALGFGAGGTVSVFIKPFEQEFGWLRADSSMAYTMYTIGAAVGGLVWGSLSDRIGARKIALLGSIALAAGWTGMGLGSYQAGYFYDITATYLLSYANAAIAGVANLLTVAALFWFRHHRTLRQAASLGPA